MLPYLDSFLLVDCNGMIMKVSESAQLDYLVRLGKLQVAQSDPRELAGLLRSAMVWLHDARRTHLPLPARFNLAYNAGYTVALAALRFAGFRCLDHHLTFQCLAYTMQPTAEQWILLSGAYARRNLPTDSDEPELTSVFIDALIAQVEQMSQVVWHAARQQAAQLESVNKAGCVACPTPLSDK